MARPKYYSAYAYEWTELLYAVTENPEGLTLTLDDSKTFNRIRNEWAGFKEALKHEANFRKDTTPEHRDHMQTLFNMASQIVGQAAGDCTLRFIKKGHTKESIALRQALDATSFHNPEMDIDPLPEEEGSDPLAEERKQKDAAHAAQMDAIFGSKEDDNG